MVSPLSFDFKIILAFEVGIRDAHWKKMIRIETPRSEALDRINRWMGITPLPYTPACYRDVFIFLDHPMWPESVLDNLVRGFPVRGYPIDTRGLR